MIPVTSSSSLSSAAVHDGPPSPATLSRPRPGLYLSPSTVRRQAPPSLALEPTSFDPLAEQRDLFDRPPALPLSARLASEDDHPTLLVSPSTPTFRTGPTRRTSDGMPTTAATTTTTRQLYASAVPGKPPTSPPASSALSPAIPRAFVRQKLRQLAGAFYQRTDNADVTILLRLPTSSATPGPQPLTPPLTAPLHQHRRCSAPNTSEITVLTYKLHREYLCSQSSLFRRFLSSSLSPSSPPEASSSSSRPPSGPAQSRPRARLVPSMSSDDHPCLLLDIPDAGAFNLVLHWLYWNEFSVVERALNSKTVDWKVLFNTIEILGLDKEIKIHSSRWWRKWVKPSAGPSIAALAATATAAAAAAAGHDSPPSSASSGASTVMGASASDPPRPSGWPIPSSCGPSGRRPPRSSSSTTSEYQTGHSDDDDDDPDDDRSEHRAAKGRPLPSSTAGPMDGDDEDFASFAARVGRMPIDGAERVMSGLLDAFDSSVQ